MNTKIERTSERMRIIMEDLRSVTETLEWLDLCDCGGHCNESIVRIEVPATIATIAVDLESMMQDILDPGDFDFLTDRVNMQSG